MPIRDVTSPDRSSTSCISRRERVRGCLLGGAVGDALGAPVEFLSLAEIRAQFGEEGITDFAPAYGRVGAITDDTQMTLFTAEGVLRSVTRARVKGICHPPSVIHHAYLRWLHTQGMSTRSATSPDTSGWLGGIRALHAVRAPGHTCVSALQSGRMGTIEEPINGSKGCGGVMRAAPVGLVDHHDVFRLSCEVAAVTHGHPTGYLTAGCLAAIVHDLLHDVPLSEAVQNAVTRLSREKGHEETLRALTQAVDASREGSPSPERVQRLGEGWIAEEALAISAYCALVAGDDFARAVRLAVNYGGDSDSTGAITGNIVGTMLGAGAIPGHWLDQLELRREITELAEDVAVEYRHDEEWWRRYPGH